MRWLVPTWLALASCTVDDAEPSWTDGGPQSGERVAGDGDPLTDRDGGDPGVGDNGMAGDPTAGDTVSGDPTGDHGFGDRTAGDASGDSISGDPAAGDSLSGDPASGDSGLQGPAAYIVSFAVPWELDGPAADHGDVWLDVRVRDAAALGSGWRLMMASFTFVVEELHGSELPWALADGDRLRFHGPSYIGSTDQVVSDNNPDCWDVRGTEPFGLSFKHAFVWLEDSSGHMLDGVVYETSRNDPVDWLSGAAAAALQAGVAQGLWSSTQPEQAFFIVDPDTEYALLLEPTHDGASAVDWQTRGGTLPDYYTDALGKTGAELKAALHSIIRDHAAIPYDDIKNAFRVTDRDPEDEARVVQFYTGDSTQNDYNREHVWAKSHGGFDAESQAGYTDLHHIRPTRPDVNGARWHLDFDEGGALYSDTDCRIQADVSFEPRDAVKGDVARSLFYMAVRYEGDDANMPDLELVEDIPSLLDELGQPNNNEHTSTPRFGRLSRLLQWHAEDPPDDEERRRNAVIFSQFQGNRNPFIDHPEWVTEIW